MSKLLARAFKGVSSREEAMELINEKFPELAEELKEEEKPKQEETVIVEKTPEPEVKELEIEVKREAPVDSSKVLERIDFLEQQNKEQIAKIKEWEDITNKLLADKPFGIVQKVQKKEIDNIYEQYDADRIIGK